MRFKHIGYVAVKIQAGDRALYTSGHGIGYRRLKVGGKSHYVVNGGS